jgi:hypothetical protein
MPSPYAQATLFAAGALYGADVADALDGPVEAGATTTFVIPNGLFVVPIGTAKPATVEVRLNGSGFQTVTPGQPFSVVYTNAGEKTIRVRALIGGVMRHARFTIHVRETGSGGGNLLQGTPEEECAARAVASHWAPGRVYCGVTPAAQYAWQAPRDYPGVLNLYDGENRTANYDYAVSLAPGHTQITKPIIVVSGYDPFEGTGLDLIYQTLVQFDNGITVGPFVNLPLALKAQGYDLVVMDYADSHDFIPRNGLALVDLIGKVHAEMDANPNAADEISVIGFSMGGLVSRYALAYMEEMQMDHRVHLFVSYDSPQQGAYVPIGLEMMAADVYDIFDGVLDVLDFFGSDGKNFIEQRLYGASIQQLLTFWTGTDVDAASPGAVQTQIRKDLYADLLGLGDYPDDLRRVAISNGNGNGRRQHLAEEWDEPSPPRMQPGAQALYAAAGGSVLWGLLGAHHRFITRNAAVSGIAAQVYRHYQQLCFIACFNDTVEETTLTLPNPYDVVPGGYRPSYAAFEVEHFDSRSALYGLGALIHVLGGPSLYFDVDTYAQRHAFVPTVSALDYRTDYYSSREALVDATFLNQDLGATINRSDASRTQFDALFMAGDKGDAASIGLENQAHLFVSDGIKAFILEQLTLPIPDHSPPSLTVSISGPSTVLSGQSAAWSASVAGGAPPYTYQWQYRYNDDGGGGGCPSCPEGPWVGWSDGGTAASMTHTFYAAGDHTVMVIVTDDAGTTRSATQGVTVTNGRIAGAETGGAGAHAQASLGTGSIPEAFALHAVAPNPVNRTAAIRYDLPEASEVSLVVYDLLGREAARLAGSPREAGMHSIALDAADLPSGVYLVRLQAGSFVATERFTLVR